MHASFTLAAAPGSVPLIGHVLHLLARPLQLFRSLRAHGDIVVIRLGSTPIYVVNHPELIRQVLVADARKFDKGVQFEKARPFVGNGIATSSEPVHLRQRRLIQPAFHHTQIARYVERMCVVSQATIAGWQRGAPVRLDDELSRLAIRILTDTLFSTEADADVIAEVTTALPVLLDGIAWRIAVPGELLERLPSRANRRFEAGRARLRATIARIVASHRGAAGAGEDLLAMLLAARDEQTGVGMTDEQVHDEIMAMMLAGTETTASTLAWVCHLLSEHPAVQERVRAELDAVLGERPLGLETAGRLVFMRCTIQEALRLYPPVWLTSRRPLVEVELGGHRIPAGANVFFSAYGVHRDPALYPEPDLFQPDRWADEQLRSASRSTFIPFGAGPRGCVGESFAWAEMTAFLATLLRDRVLRPAPGARVKVVARGSLRAHGLSVITDSRR